MRPPGRAQNVDSRTHNVRLRQPANLSVWSVDPPTMNVKLAPGMETTVQVFFCTDAVADFRDVLHIASATERVEVPLEARAPAPNVTVRPPPPRHGSGSASRSPRGFRRCGGVADAVGRALSVQGG